MFAVACTSSLNEAGYVLLTLTSNPRLRTAIERLRHAAQLGHFLLTAPLMVHLTGRTWGRCFAMHDGSWPSWGRLVGGSLGYGLLCYMYVSMLYPSWVASALRKTGLLPAAVLRHVPWAYCVAMHLAASWGVAKEAAAGAVRKADAARTSSINDQEPRARAPA